MRVSRVEIYNFRLLKEFSLDLEDEMSIIIGKNNTGKTSILTCLDKFVTRRDKKDIKYEDLNVDLRSRLERILSGLEEIGPEDQYLPLGMQLKIYIKYADSDDLSAISPLIMSLDPDDDNVVLSFEYKISFKNLNRFKADYTLNSEKFDRKPSLFIKEKMQEYFGAVMRKSLLFEDENKFIDIQKEKINLDDILDINFISAKRGVTNKQNDKTLSSQTSSLYKQADESEEQEVASDEFKQELRRTDDKLSDIYQKMFKGTIDQVNKFGGVAPNDTAIKITSSLQHRELLEGNTTVVYAHENHDFPEHYNGLGYMNLISMIFDIEMLMSRMRRSIKETPAAINLLFIEEPEAHTHPQMQYIFINNIKTLLKQNRLRDDGVEIHLQSVITTHSSHIVAESSFDDIKYLKKSNQTHKVQAKNLKDLEAEYSCNENTDKDAELKRAYKFLKQYLTLNRSELFFADKAIFIEGDTERIILPSMMKKIDQEEPCDEEQPLLSQNISIVEVGAHSQTFEKFIDFIGIKSLIITDIDSSKEVEDEDDANKIQLSKCNPSDMGASKTTNASLKFFFGTSSLDYFKSLDFEHKSLAKVEGEPSWEYAAHGPLKIVYQTEEDGYSARSYEDAFFSINKSILDAGHDAFPSLTKKHLNKFLSGEHSPYEFADKAINSKPSLAIEILFNSEKSDKGEEYSNWKIPLYIKEGLLWLRQN